MSGISDRLAPFHGRTELGRQACAYPAPHSDQETESISTQSDDFSDLFDWDLYARGEATDVTTLPDAPSEGKSAPRSSSPQAPAGSAATVTDIDGDCLMSDVESQEPQPPHVWPIISGPHPPRPRDVNDIHLEGSPSPSPITEDQGAQSPIAHRPNTAEMLLVGQTPSSPSQKKTRILKCPEETNQVRDLKACYHCKMNKSKCDAALVCLPCRKHPFSELACIRRPPQTILDSVYARWNWNDPEFPSRGQFAADQQLRLFVSFSDGTNSPCLEVTARPFLLPNQTDPRVQGIQRWGILPDERPSEDMLYQWAKQQILSENSTGFEAEMDRLLVWYENRLGHSLALPINTLLVNLSRMRCMWKLWSCKLFVRPHAASPSVSPFDLRLASVQESLRLFAAQKISELERRIVSDIETHLLKKDTARGAQPLRPRLNITKWLLLWQIILMYRQSLSWMLQQESTNAAPIHIAVMPMSARRHNFRETTIELLNAMTVIYSGVFHKSTTVESIRDAGPEAFGEDCHLHMLFQRAWQALPEFYEQVSRQVSPTDELFKDRIVRKETKILAKGRPTRK